MDQQSTKQNIIIKLGFFYFFMLIDLISSSFIEPHLNSTNSAPTSNAFIPLIIVQMVLTAILVLMFFVLMWQTFPLRQGLLADLLKYFKWPMLYSLLHLLLHIYERTIRLILWFKYDDDLDTEIWKDDNYKALYYIKYISYPIFYGLLIEGSMNLVLPKFYKAKYWLRNK